jgi:hypothetical protein
MLLAFTPFAIFQLCVSLLAGSFLFSCLVSGLAVLAVLSLAFLDTVTPAWLLPTEFMIGTAGIALFLAVRGRLAEDNKFVRRFAVLLFVLGVVNLLRLLLHSQPLVDTSAWGIVFLCLSYAAGFFAKELFGKGLLINAALFIGSVALMSGVLEMATRLILNPTPATINMFRVVPAYGHLTQPDGKATFQVLLGEGKVLPVLHRISHQGLRDRVYGPKSPNEFRVLLLGDSFTQGHAVKLEDSIPKQLETLLAKENLAKKVSVINGGFCSAGPLQELGMLCEYALKLQPDFTVLQLFPTNDIDDALAVKNMHMRCYDVQTQDFLKTLRLLYTPAYRAEFWVRRHCAIYRVLARTFTPRKFIVEALEQVRFLPTQKEKPLRPSENRCWAVEINLREWYPELCRGLELLKQGVQNIQSVSLEHNIGFAAYCIPSAHDLYDDQWQHAFAPGQMKDYERCKGLHATQAMLDEAKIDSFSVEETLRSHMGGDPLYYFLDGHLTKYGNFLVAERMRDFLIEGPLKELKK